MATQALHVEKFYEYGETRALTTLVNDAAALVLREGEAAFDEFRKTGSRWRQGETYVFVLDPEGNMVVHPDAAMEGRSQLGLKDVGGKSIVRGLIDAATVPGKPEGWYHYQWPVPGGLLPRWKTSYVRLVHAASGKRYVVGSGMYNDRMERAFVVDLVDDAVALIEKKGEAAYPLLRDPKGRFMAKDAYVFVISAEGIELVNPAFPTLEGRNLLDVKDTQGKPLIREIVRTAQTSGAGWVDYMWPKPGDSVSTQKSTYVRKVAMGNTWVVVGCGVYLADAPKALRTTTQMTPPELTALVREAASLLERDGEKAFPAFRIPGSKWFQGDTYIFVTAMDGTRIFHAAEPTSEGRKETLATTDAIGRPFIRMFVDAVNSPAREGWVHYMYPEPGNIFPCWKSAFARRVTFPSGTQAFVGCGIYNMQMDKTFIEDVVDRAAALVAARKRDAFADLRDKTGPFVFMDTYVFVMSIDGTELVNAAQPSLEGKNVLDLEDLTGKAVAREEIAAALKDGRAWLDCFWYKPGNNTPARKLTYVRKVMAGQDTYIVGSGLYLQ